MAREGGNIIVEFEKMDPGLREATRHAVEFYENMESRLDDNMRSYLGFSFETVRILVRSIYGRDNIFQYSFKLM